MRRQPNGHAKIGHDKTRGRYETKVTVRTADGGTRRINVRARTAAEVASKVGALKGRIVRRGGVVPTETVMTVAEWMAYWNDRIVKPNRAWKYWAGNRSMIARHVVPRIGQWKLDGPNRIEPEHLEAMFADLAATSLTPKYRRNIYVMIHAAFEVAWKRGKMPHGNVADMITAPSARGGKKVEPIKKKAAKALLAEATSDEEYGLRWILGFVSGPRRGEVTGIRWPNVELDPEDEDEEPHIRFEKQIQRHSWEHGCADPVACVKALNDDRKVCRTAPCPRWEHGCGDPQDCTRNRSDKCPQRRERTRCATHRRPCPQPCPPDCTSHARLCPSRTGGGLVDVELKTEGSERSVPLGLLTELVRRHRERQIQAFADHGLTWDPAGYMFVRFVQGRRGGWRAAPVDPRVDYERWLDLERRAGVAHVRPHAARHTAGTQVRAATSRDDAQALLGHASGRTTDIYAEAPMDRMREAVDAVARALLDGATLEDIMRAAGVS